MKDGEFNVSEDPFAALAQLGPLLEAISQMGGDQAGGNDMAATLEMLAKLGPMMEAMQDMNGGKSMEGYDKLTYEQRAFMDEIGPLVAKWLIKHSDLTPDVPSEEEINWIMHKIDSGDFDEECDSESDNDDYDIIDEDYDPLEPSPYYPDNYYDMYPYGYYGEEDEHTPLLRAMDSNF